MRPTPLALLVGFVLVAAPLAIANLEEPKPNRGATEVEVTGTKVRAEAWAVADGHEVESIVIARLAPKTEGAPVVETYERWSLDGRKKLERGNRELAKTWEKHLWAILEEVEKRANPKAGRLPRKDLLERFAKGIGSAGSRLVGSWVMGWSLGEGRAEKGGRVSVGRTAVFTFRPAGPGDAVTPPDDEAKEGAGPVTPGDGADPIERLLRRSGLPSSGSGSGRASGRGVIDTEKGVREHALVEVDLQTIPRPKAPVEPPSETTPRDR